jgi:hypothetical protein
VRQLPHSNLLLTKVFTKQEEKEREKTPTYLHEEPRAP